jgi:hypothetical protein
MEAGFKDHALRETGDENRFSEHTVGQRGDQKVFTNSWL